MHNLKKSLLILICNSFILTIYAKPNSDLQSWNNLTLIYNSNVNLNYWLESQLRFGEDISQLSQYIIRTAVGTNIKNTDHSLWFGYAWINTNKPFTTHSIDENRLWQQYMYSHNFNFGKFTTRTRIEQRFIENNTKTSWRFRENLRLQSPIVEKSRYFISVYDEIFLNINNTANNGNNSGFEQNRLFFSIGSYLQKTIMMEIGYQNQIIERNHQNNFIGHALVLNIKYEK